MTVYLGNSGRLLLARNDGQDPFFTQLEPSDVNDTANRFAVDYAHEQVITGDRITIGVVGGNQVLDWVDGADTEITRYAHVDAAGGIRLYSSFQAAINGENHNAVSLTVPATAQELVIRIDNSGDRRCLAQITDYAITTSRENLDTTSLSDRYRKQYENGLIQGQGTISCFWEFNPELCDSMAATSSEYASYIAKLCVRLQQGCSFEGFFYLYYNNAEQRSGEYSIWYECKRCVITEVAVTVDVDQPIKTDIKFVTNGQIKLQEGYIPAYILTESSTKGTASGIGIGLEQEGDGALELDNPDE